MDPLQVMKMTPLVVKGQAILFTQAQPLDAADLLRVIYTAYAEFRDKLNPPSGAFAETEQSIHEKLTNGGAIKAVVGNAMGNELIGCVLYEPKGDFMYFGRLAVLPVWRRFGVARGLIAAVEEQSKAAGLRRVQIGVRLALPTHQSYYEALGYQPIEYTCHPGFAHPTSVTREKQLQ